jgi:hypothetical protein
MKTNYLILVILLAIFSAGCVNEDEGIADIKSNENILVDVDGNVYNIIKIGEQVWMAENLKSTKFSNGDPIPTTPITACVANEELPIYYWYYPTDFDLYECTYYTWHALNDERGLAPKGWHIPTKEEWQIMFEEIKDKPDAYQHVAYGYRCYMGQYIKDSHDITYWWTSTSYDETQAYLRVMNVDNSEMALATAQKGFGLPIICVMDKIE